MTGQEKRKCKFCGVEPAGGVDVEEHERWCQCKGCSWREVHKEDPEMVWGCKVFGTFNMPVPDPAMRIFTIPPYPCSHLGQRG